MVRGLWIINFDWITSSLEANEWLPEEPFELNSFSKMVKVSKKWKHKIERVWYFILFQICRIEKQVLGRGYRMDIFSDAGSIFVSRRCACKSLSDLIRLCHGKITAEKNEAKYIIDECNDDKEKSISLTMNWILDSIAKGKRILDYRPYLFQ